MAEDELRGVRAANAELRLQLAALREQGEASKVDAERFRSLIAISSDWYWEQDADLRFTMRTGWSLGEEVLVRHQYLGLRRWEQPGIAGPVDWDAHRRDLDARRPFRGLEYRLQIGNEVVWVSINGEPIFGSDGTFLGYRGTGRDISQRKRIEAELRASEERFHEIVGSMPVGLFIKDPEGRVILMNRECERQWGVRFEQIRNTDGSAFYPRETMNAFRAQDRHAFACRRVIEYEELVSPLDHSRPIIARGMKKPVYDEAGQPRYLIGISIDISAHKRSEEQLRESREALRQLARYQTHVKEEERKRIARDIHDELGQNLMALRLDVGSLINGVSGDGSALSERAKLMMETVDRTIRSVRLIINDLRPAVLDLGLQAAVEWQVAEFMRRTNISCTLEIDFGEGEPAVEDDVATTFFRVLQESLTNVQRHANASWVRVGLHQDGTCLRLSIADDGKGGALIRRGKHSFGLLGMRERLKALGGSLEVVSKTGVGTRLTASLPLKAAPLAQS
ncbi:MAG TPA: PAS domain S-box protein [Noviherbaspirillum sp.]|nr:PAS domain S-box protein [Noviherbaspirillum sp.]